MSYTYNPFRQQEPSVTLKSQTIFSNFLPKWNTLTQTEKVTTLLITLTPLWWLLGWKHFFILLAIGLITHDLRQYNKIQLKPPSIPVVALLIFCAYTLISQYFYNAYQNTSFSPNAILAALNTYAGPGIILWYLQSHNIRIRWQVVAWSFSVLMLIMLLFWLVIYVGWQQTHYDPPRSLYGLVTGKSELYVPGAGNSNYLIPYFATDESFIPGFVRYVYFFPGPEALALIAGFTSLLALELKPRVWSISLFAIALFILLTSGTRSVVIVLPLISIVRGLFSLRKSLGAWFLCLFLATLSFTTLSMPSITHYLFDTVTNTVEAVGEARADSTEVRGDIYRETLDSIMQGSNRQFFGGHVTTGETVLPGYDPARIGSHSFWLGTLLYRSGVIGSFIFLIFWLSLIWTICRRSAQSLSICKSVFILLTISLIVMEIEMPVMAITILCVVMQDKSSNSSLVGSNSG
ncbi:MAG: hypothetical protein KTR27_02625 [Leptolyngbyaceae cyanobacterium MAG.088]|nr:hypothetical protein [Leptolyngbyaceae cyanobacterium MAG.088]